MTIPYTYASATSGDRYVDGNALAGLLSEFFPGDPTLHECRCGTCGSTEPLARALVYLNCPGTVIRCPHCAAVILQLTTTPAGTYLTITATLHFPPQP
ncbi:DUF6510 family protein [Nocardia seriolae]|uniref:Uncharacterized protein n=1 Tax=Nocardia seriolae TaxID=37332 RepID=A0A0B8NG51_9NOCA|nr:DUF6510 family protein [Nocardia seriolae]APA97213.1 hypothetical protein NS506_03157 [Nocardia seriolae]MTJ62142.1 hypothetical protein [Nocardia seriolae]MTJ75801.1 hypothetical protein [Nocardia seriolae]MTJ87054.1 hypothetical protein [Nocardia seriolae]MTK31049.1 hypothetical protein [Nocardia seriolae]